MSPRPKHTNQFALIFGEVAEVGHADSIARRNRAAIEAPIRIGEITVGVSASIGLTIAGEPPESTGAEVTTTRIRRRSRGAFGVNGRPVERDTTAAAACPGSLDESMLSRHRARLKGT